MNEDIKVHDPGASQDMAADADAILDDTRKEIHLAYQKAHYHVGCPLAAMFTILVHGSMSLM